MKKPPVVLALMALLWMGSGCFAVFRTDVLNELQSFPTSDWKPALRVSFESPSGGEIEPASRLDLMACMKRVEESDLFSEVGEEVKNADLYLSYSYRVESYMSIAGAVLVGVTLYLVPARVGRTLNVIDAEVIDARTGERHSIHLQEQLSTWYGLFMLPVSPFRGLLSEADGSWRRLCEYLALRTFEVSEGSPAFVPARRVP